jgi:hypothetical protein
MRRAGLVVSEEGGRGGVCDPWPVGVVRTLRRSGHDRWRSAGRGELPGARPWLYGPDEPGPLKVELAGPLDAWRIGQGPLGVDPPADGREMAACKTGARWRC